MVTSVDVDNDATNVIPAEARATFNIRFNNLHTTNSLELMIKIKLTKLLKTMNLIIIVMQNRS